MNWKDTFCKAIWPTTRCVICGGNSDKFYPGLCRDCLERIVENREKEVFCSRCGMFYGNSFRNCPHCYFDAPRYSLRDGLFCAVPYDEDSGVLVKKLKYGNRRDLAEAMTRLFFRYTDIDAGFDLVTAVPLHKKKQRLRGFNQSEELARRIAAAMGLPYEALLERKVNTVSQTKLSHQRRLKNMKGAFSLVSGTSAAGKRILLIDDVVTTGTTIKECAAVLKTGGAKRVGLGAFAAAKMKDGC